MATPKKDKPIVLPELKPVVFSDVYGPSGENKFAIQTLKEAAAEDDEAEAQD